MPKTIPLAKMTSAARAKRVALLAKNPGTRAAIPLKYLPAQYRGARSTAQRIKTENATLYNPLQVLSGNDLRKAVKSEVGMQIDPTIASLNREIGNTTQQRDVSLQRAGGYFDRYNAATASAANALSSSGQQLAEKLAQLGQQTQGQIAGFQAQANDRNAADAALRGPGLTDTQPTANAFDFEKATAGGAAASYLGQGGAQAQGFGGLAGTIAATGPMRAGDTMGILANTFNKQLTDFYAKRQETEAQRGPLTAQTLNKMRQDQFTNLATMKGLDIKQADLTETTRKNKATEDLTADAITQRDRASRRTANTARERATAKAATDAANLDIKRGIDPITGKRLKKEESPSAALDKWRLDFARKHGYLPSTGAPKGASAGDKVPHLTTNERITQAQKFGPIKNIVTGSIKKDFPDDRHGAARALLADNPNVDPLYASIALDVAYDGHVSRANAKKLHDRGLRVKDFNVDSYADWKRKHPARDRRAAGRAIPVTR